MKNGTCIYCNELKLLNREHTLPQSLRQRNTPEWIIDNHLCRKCNSDFGDIDMVLSQRSNTGFLFDIIQRERGQENKSIQASPYHKRASGVNPIRMLFPNPVYDDLIVLHEPDSMNYQANYLGVIALQPQMILTQYRNGQTSREVVEENNRKYDAKSSRNDNWYTHDEKDDVFCLFGNTHIFPPNTAHRYLGRVDDFKSKFMKHYPRTRYDLRVISPEEGKGIEKFHAFFNAIQAETKLMIPEDKDLPVEVFRKPITVITDKKAELLFLRAIAKLAFHCFLYHYPKFTGHEVMFQPIKDFIRNGGDAPLRFVTAVKDYKMESRSYDTTIHQHYFRYFVKDDNIGCQIDLFTGMTAAPFSYNIVLAGDDDKIQHVHMYREETMPFIVHAKSLLKRKRNPRNRIVTVKNRIIPASEVGIIQPSKMSDLLWLRR